MMARLSGLEPRRRGSRRTGELLDRFELGDAARKRAKTYSGGMRRRLDLAISLLLTPPVVFLDEPTTGLDTRSKFELWDSIRGLADSAAPPCCSPPSTSKRPTSWPTASRCSTAAAIVAEGTAAELKARIGGEVLALHDAQGEVMRELPTDGTLAGLRAALATLDRRRDGDVGEPAPSEPRRRVPRGDRSSATGVHVMSATVARWWPRRTFVKRSIIHAIRTPDALIMATVFPIIMMLLFTYVFGGAFDAHRRLRAVRRARHHPAVRGLRRGLGRRRRRAGHDDRDHRPLPHHADPGIRGHHRAHRDQPDAQPGGDLDRDRRGHRGGLPTGCHAPRVDRAPSG